MIDSVRVHNVATYLNPVEFKPKKLNFIYGSNGSGKTTISKLLGNQLVSDDCLIKKNSDRGVSVLCYNKKFVEENFQQSENLKGIFKRGFSL
ncbi:AAA family ATPase [Enterococcus raffinosus]|uniref:Protein CR006 P-loop domain-containing protein n=1 Tax=Enterococcus raffinosus ATCC 49464 TaxID=1158602 RepID=R2RRV7_9ENTE|nr:AAA family ATPase [Enterococcus raffinosus]EOH78694.1 hypothetical protein UAK_01968 [Enterococcus raffinosus ATCC 49464]EOT72441.1 hypothetical protein I590_03663 [Enterococcus raffinosus ATCC 49464]MDT2571695.1 AAA family ATPase [Enterococcus raffinosus]QXJ59014.1 AAA family ATPase [Enterococcus raffinosus]UXK03922.1 AAA family ATPase [Enterococcus raffinosus]